MRRILVAAALMLVAAGVSGGEADVEKVQVEQAAGGVHTFRVTVRHADTGWEHYADKWDVLVDGKVVATRTLHHPHVSEQPFTRSLSNVRIDPSATAVTVRAHDSQHGYGGKEFTVELR